MSNSPPGARRLAAASLAVAFPEKTEAERDRLGTLRDVLWREGPYGLLPAVLRCCELIGFRTGGDERAPLLYGDADQLLLEVEGSREAVGMAPHYRATDYCIIAYDVENTHESGKS